MKTRQRFGAAWMAMAMLVCGCLAAIAPAQESKLAGPLADPNDRGIKHVWLEGPGSHEWQVWRKHLHDFAPRLFKSEP